MIQKIIKRLFFYENYVVAYRFLNDNNTKIGVSTPTFDIINPKGFTWYADPFPYKYQDKHYIFVEEYNIWKSCASIAVYCIEERKKPKTIISEDFHMSYPNVFCWNKEIYMIPETHEAKQLRLYKCIEFPEKWKLHSILLDNVDFADSSLLINNEGIWIETMEDQGNLKYSNRFFRLDIEQLEMFEIFPDKNFWIDKRPAGNFFKIKDEWHHALQECSSAYGEYMHIARVITFNNQDFKEEIYRELRTSDYKIKSSLPFIYTHTLNRCNNLEVIDLLFLKFSIFKPIAALWRKLCRQQRSRN